MSRRREESYTIATNENTGSNFKKRYYKYKLSESMKHALSGIIKELLHGNWIQVHAYNGITEVKSFIRKIYKNTKFHIDSKKNHIFTLKGKRYSLNRSKIDNKVYIYHNNTVEEWFYFYKFNLQI